MKYITSIIIFIGFCSLSLFTGWMSGWNFERSKWVGAWTAITILFAIYLSTAPFVFKWFKKG